ncbi:peroxiredoxin family protein [Cohnella faecalis]|uniref:peroxiredoxin family protein n=1 Tax=Cohnella faecalis TaxID=2315694 RepID=UPI0039892A3B
MFGRPGAVLARTKLRASSSCHDTYKKELTIIAINLTAPTARKSAREFADEYGFSFPVLWTRTVRWRKRYKIRPIPSTFFIDKDGYIVDGVLAR